MQTPSPPLVSCLCLTTHPKRAAFLPDALRAYRQQTYPNKELVVVNDGAPLVTNQPDIRIVQMPVRARRWSIGEKRNEGIRSARGTYLAVWDDDDVMMPHRLERSVTCAQDWNADVVLADRMLIADEDLNLLGDCDRGRVVPVMASVLMRRDAVIAAGGYDAVDYREDAALLERLRLLARRHVATMRGADWYVVRRHGSNMTLEHGNQDATYKACAARSPEVKAQQAALDAVHRGPGGNDVVGWTP